MNRIERTLRLWRSRASLAFGLYRRYKTVAAWGAAIRLPQDCLGHPDTKLREAWYAEFMAIKGYLWSRHLASLSLAEQQALADGSHPALSHDREASASPFCPLLEEALVKIGCEAKVSIGFYHFDQIIMSVRLLQPADLQRKDLPEWFRGFQVRYYER